MVTPLHTLAYVLAHQYKDSVALMRVAQRLLALPEVVTATLQLGNPANKEILLEAGLLTPAVKDAGPSDIMVVVQARTLAACEAAVQESKNQLAGQSGRPGAAGGAVPDEGEARTLAMGAARMASANIAQISVPGAYAAAEALKALQLGLNVFLFSDNVPLEQEVALKHEAARRGLLVMGPDCGTALIGGVPLGFANNVRRGTIGLVAASGTGLQEVTTQIHRLGGGVSHAIGTGGRDVQAAVGAITLLQGITLLAQDVATEVIVVLCKPPAPAVADRVLAALRDAGKPAVVMFLGSALQASGRVDDPVHVAHTLVDCAAAALRLAGAAPQAARRGAAQVQTRGAVAAAVHERTPPPPMPPYPMPARPRFAASQKHLRALFSGGTYATEAQVLWAKAGLQVWSNVPLDKSLALPDPKRRSRGHTALDLGDDQFTVGRPHPMIDQATRIERLLKEAADPEVRVIVLDVVLGWGAHADPAGELAPVIAQARAIAARAGRALAVIGFVCGTELDPQGLARQEATLRKAGMVLAGNSANAAWLAGQWLR
jgi:succinyl-CoA synthetase alpha subunit